MIPSTVALAKSPRRFGSWASASPQCASILRTDGAGVIEGGAPSTDPHYEEEKGGANLCDGHEPFGRSTGRS
eukprot:8713581-Pyramimonas_sp.AAC.1